MKQVIQSFKSGEICIENVPAPVVRPGGLLVSTRSSLVSAGTERQIVNLAKKSLLGKARARPDLVKKVLQKIKTDGLVTAIEMAKSRLDRPFPLGYSCAGVVLEVGERGSGFCTGDRIACGGQNYACHAEVNFVPKNLCVKIPAGVDMESASFTTIGAIALQAVRQADVRLGETIAVIGLGLIGQILVQLLKASGCIVIGNDPDADRANLAKEMGCDEVAMGDLRPIVASMTHGHGADSVIIAASTASNLPVEVAGEICRSKGKVVVLGTVGMSIPRKLYYERELDIRFSMSYGPGRYDPNYEERGHDYPYAYVRWTENRNMKSFLRLVAERTVNVAKLVTHRFPLANAREAYDLVSGSRKEPFLGILLLYPDYKAEPEARVIIREEARPPRGGRPLPTKAAIAGVVGSGDFAQSVLLPNLARLEGCRLRGLASVRGGGNAKHVAKKMGFEFCCGDYKELLSDSEINTIFIVTRHNTHAHIVCDALSAGKHVYVEKPLCLNADELRDITETYNTQRGRCLLMVGFNRRFAPFITKLKEAFEGRGTPLMMNYRINAGEIPETHWVQAVEEGGGRIIGETCHFVDLLGFLAGSRLESIDAACIDPGDTNVIAEDNVIMTLKFGDGSIGTITYTSMGDKSIAKEYLEVFGGGRGGILDNFRRLILTREGKMRTTRHIRQKKGRREAVRAFVSAVICGAPSPIPYDDICTTTEATFQVVKSLKRNNEG